MSQITIGILMGLGFTALMALAIFFDHDYNLKDCKGYGGVLFLQGIAACLIFGGIGWRSDINEKINKFTIKHNIFVSSYKINDFPRIYSVLVAASA